MTTLNAKVLLFGEYSIFFESMALTIPFKGYSGKFSYPNGKHDDPRILASNKRLREYLKFITEHHIDPRLNLNLERFQKELEKGLYFESDIPQGFGLGSSGALVAAIFLRYVDDSAELSNQLQTLTKDRIRNLKDSLGRLEDPFHGTSSGLDPLSVLANEPLLIRPQFDIAPTAIPESKMDGQHVVFLLNTKIERDTESLVAQFKKACEGDGFVERVNRSLTTATNAAIESFLQSDYETLYENVDQISRFHLDEMEFVIPRGLRPLIETGIESGAYHLKICGAGGGGFLLGFTADWQATENRLREFDLEIFHRS